MPRSPRTRRTRLRSTTSAALPRRSETSSSARTSTRCGSPAWRGPAARPTASTTPSIESRPKRHGDPEGSLGRRPPGQAYLLDVQAPLHLAQHGVVDRVLVTQAQDGGAFAGEEFKTQRGVVLVVAQHF